MASSYAPQIQTFVAGGVIAKGKGVKFGSDNKTVVVASATTDKVIGIAQSASAASGDLIEIALPGGGGKGLAAGIIALGDFLGVDSAGALQKVANANDRVVAVAMDSAVANDIFGVHVIMAQATAAQA